ncbi:MAG: hypothetical protein KJO09_01360 [Gammaproteobacteria bacterium]|jgi:hypothetical protein|nr:hypothetical protein [Gammaproteobacteria bacterium]
MDSGWIQVFVLTLVECVAPAGKTVCQQQELELTFLTQADCQTALEQMVSLKDAAENVIIDKSNTRCEATARQQTVFANVADVADSVGSEVDWRAPMTPEKSMATIDANYQSRLAQLKTCDETKDVPPCKIGEIIVEADVSGEPVEVWRLEKK